MDDLNLKCLTNPAMVGATGGWVDPAQERPLLDDNARAQLQQVPTINGNLAQAVDAWFESGAKLGELERQRAQLAE